MSFRGTTQAGAAPAESGPAAAGTRDVAPAGAAFGVADLMGVIRQRLRLIRLVVLSILALTLLVLMILPTVYSASAVVMVDQRKNNIADLSAVLSELPTDTASLQNQIQLLTSRDLAGAVVDRLGLIHDPEFNPQAKAPAQGPWRNVVSWLGGQAAPGLAEQREATIDALLRHLSVDAIGLSTSMEVRVTASSAAKAARIANTVAAAYVAEQLKMKSVAADTATAWLTARAAQLSDQIQAADATVETYRAAHNLNLAADGSSLVDQQLSAISTQLVQAEADLASKEASYNRIAALVASGHGADVSQVVASPLIVQLRTQEADLTRQIAEFVTRYGPLNPKLIAATSQR
ncbi:MAG: GumC family protein, partial [Pseudomonadota bacterium]|nr:GumC family protein [Pseudomonadota bacterium]